MKLHYYKAPQGNFGDGLNEWIWDRLIPGWRNWDEDATLLGVGTILTQRQVSQIATKIF